MADTTYQPKTYRKDGGDTFVVASGGKILFETGGTMEIETELTITGDIILTGDLTLTLEDIWLKDNKYLQFGDAAGGDVSMRWLSASPILQILPAADDTGAINIGDGTTDIDFKVFLGTSGKFVDFNVGDSLLVVSAGVQLDVDDTTASTNTATGSIHTAGGLGVAGATYLGTILGLNSAASDLILIANTAAALEFYDATTKFLVADTRNTVTADMLTVTGIPATIAGASGVTRRMLNIVPGTTTLTGSTGVTDMTGIGLYVTAPTLTDASAITVAEASTVEIAGAPVAAGSVTITKGLALKVASGKSMFAGTIDVSGLVTSTSVTGFKSAPTFVPEGTRSNYAFSVGGRSTGIGELDVTMAAAVTQHLDPFQMNLNIIGANPTNSSTVNGFYQLITHDTTDMSFLRLKNADWNVVIAKDILDAYCYQGEIDYTAAGVAVGGESAVAGFVMNAGADAVTGSLRGIILSMTGAGMPAGAVGIEIRANAGAGLGTGLAEGIRIMGTPLPICGIAMGDQTGDNQGPQFAFFFPSGGGLYGADQGPIVHSVDANTDAEGSIAIKVGAVTKYIQYFPNATA